MHTRPRGSRAPRRGPRVIGASPIDDAETGRDRVLAAGLVPTLRVEAREDLVMAGAATRLVAALD
jgi:hypothetical protein